MNKKKGKINMNELLAATKANSKYIEEHGAQLIEVFESQWRRLKKTNSQV